MHARLLCSLATLTFVTLNAQQLSAPHSPNSSKPMDPVDAAALQAFGNTVQCMFNIIQDPDDKKNVFNNLGIIASNIFNVIAQASAHHKNNAPSVVDATEEINALYAEQLTLTYNIHTMLASIGKVIESLGRLMHESCDADNIGNQINTLLEKIVSIAVEIMKSNYLNGHATEYDFVSYLNNLEELQEKIKHSMLANAQYLRSRKENASHSI